MQASTDLLVVAPNWLGDLVMSTVLLDRLDGLRNEPGSHPFTITLALREAWLPLMLEDPRIDRMLPLSRTGRHRGVRGVPSLAREWSRCGFDAVILLPPSLRVAAVAALAGIPRRIGYRADGRGLLLTDSFARPPRGRMHYTQECLVLAEAWAQDVAEVSCPPAKECRPALPACRGVAPTGSPAADGVPIWIVAVGATYGEAKSWPASNTAEFLQLAVAEAGVRVVLLGDAAAVGRTAALRHGKSIPWRRMLAGGPGVVDLVGRTDLLSAVGLLRAAEVFVGNDSGLMHLAAALDVATIGLFGSSSPDWTAPTGRRAVALSAEGFDCRPCFRRVCNQDRFCLAEISAEKVMRTVRDLIAVAEVAP